MVFISRFLYKRAKNAFIDTIRIHAKGGHGGNGLPKYGGIGGQGGCVYFIAKESCDMKQVLRDNSTKRIAGGNGEDSSKIRVLGRRGEDKIVEVPVGIRVIDETGRILGELDEEDKKCLGAGGGIGGCSGNSFIGTPGQSKNILLDLKLIADIGLVGFPNAGKSTLVKAISNASPKIASYPFTTIRPQIGVINYKDYRQITIADLPGLIEGAHANFGMGHTFLKHVERTRLLLLIVDVFGFQLSPMYPRRNCLENIYALNKELELYDKTLLEKPAILLINKMDMEGSIEEYKKFEKYIDNLKEGLNLCPKELLPEKLLHFEKVIPISAKNVKEIDKVKISVRETLDDLALESLQEEQADNVQKKLKLRLGEKGPKLI